MNNQSVGVLSGGNGAVEAGSVEERELQDAFEDALERDNSSRKKEIDKETYLEVKRIENKFKDDPYMLAVKVQDMRDTTILSLFGRVRDNMSKKES